MEISNKFTGERKVMRKGDKFKIVSYGWAYLGIFLIVGRTVICDGKEAFHSI